MGDVFPRLDPNPIEMERERALSSPVVKDQPGAQTTPALVVQVEIQFTDPVIRSRYCRTYGSSPGFDPTNRICRGLVRRIERCSEEFLTRKDSSALDMFKEGTYERKPQRFEMTFRILRRGRGEWAERIFRSYQKQPLTIALTKEVILAAHRTIGLFLRRHDEHFRWLDCPVPEADLDGEAMSSSRPGYPSLLSVPRSLFVEATQSFEFVPGYTIELCFRSKNRQRKVPVFERRLKMTSTQTTPLTRLMSEDLLWKALQAVNHGLDLRKREWEDNHPKEHHALHDPHPDGDALEIDLRVSNNLGPAHDMQRNIKTSLALFRHSEAEDCIDFLDGVKHELARIRNEADARVNAMNDFDFRIVELKGVSWTLCDPANFTLGPSASYGRRTIQAALDRIQTGIGDVIRGHNIAIHIKAFKRGHLVLDKAIVAHEKRGKPRDAFLSPEEAKVIFTQRLKTRIQKDLDMVFDDSCSIDDIPEDEDDLARPSTPSQPERQALSDGAPSPMYSPASTKSSPGRRFATLPKTRVQRVFSLSRRSSESVRSIDYLHAAADDPFMDDSSRPSTAASERCSNKLFDGQKPATDNRPSFTTASDITGARRSFSLVSRRPSSSIRVSNASTLVEEQVADGDSRPCTVAGGQGAESPQKMPAESGPQEAMTSREEEASGADAPSGTLPANGPTSSTDVSSPAVPAGEQFGTTSRDDDKKQAPPAARRHSPGNMDTPEIFEDAREFATSPAPEGIVGSKLSSALSRADTPRSEGEFSTAPSTPGLSTGSSSPRPSILMTPTYLRTDSETKDPIRPGPRSESRPDDARVNLPAEIPATTASKKDQDRPATDSYPIGQDEPGRSQSAIPTPQTTAEGHDRTVVGPERQSVVGKGLESSAAVVSHRDVADRETTPTSIIDATAASSVASKIDTTTGSANEAYNAKLGAESPTESDGRSHSPDFPTSEVRTPNPHQAQGQDYASVSHGQSFESVPGPANKPEPPLRSNVGEDAGSQPGTVTGAEAQPVEHDLRKVAVNDVQKTPVRNVADRNHGVEPAVVPSGPEVRGEIVPHGTQFLLEADAAETAGETKVPTGGSGPDAANDTEGDVGSAGNVDGPRLGTDDQREEQTGAEEMARDVIVAEKTENHRMNVECGLQRSGDALEEPVSGNDGPGSTAKPAQPEPEGNLLGRTLETADEKLQLAKTSDVSEERLSELPSELGATPGAPEAGESEQVGGVEQLPTAPPAAGTEEHADSRSAGEIVVGSVQSFAKGVGDAARGIGGAVTAVLGQGAVPEEQATAAAARREELLPEEETKQEEPEPVPPVTAVPDEQGIELRAGEEKEPSSLEGEDRQDRVDVPPPETPIPNEWVAAAGLGHGEKLSREREAKPQLIGVPPVIGVPEIGLPKEVLTEKAFEKLIADESRVAKRDIAVEVPELPADVSVVTDEVLGHKTKEACGVPDAGASEGSVVGVREESITGIPGQDSAGESGMDTGAGASVGDPARDIEIQAGDGNAGATAHAAQFPGPEPEKDAIEVASGRDIDPGVVDENLAVGLEASADQGVNREIIPDSSNLGLEVGKQQDFELPSPGRKSGGNHTGTRMSRLDSGVVIEELSQDVQARSNEAHEAGQEAHEAGQEARSQIETKAGDETPKELEAETPEPLAPSKEFLAEPGAWSADTGSKEAYKPEAEVQAKTHGAVEGPSGEEGSGLESKVADDRAGETSDLDGRKLKDKEDLAEPEISQTQSRGKQPAAAPEILAEEVPFALPTALAAEPNVRTIAAGITSTAAAAAAELSKDPKPAPDSTAPEPEKEKRKFHPVKAAPISNLIGKTSSVTGYRGLQTAGFLGLFHGEPPQLVEIGLRGALGDRRHRRGHSMPVQLHQRCPMTDKPASVAVQGAAGSVLREERREMRVGAGVGDEWVLAGVDRVLEYEGELRDEKRRERGREEEQEHEPGVLPRMVLLLAGVAVVGKLLQGSSRWEV
ncbi:hypothetical protein VTK26DRAFT_6848 [Humicola hyalothermophila]